MDITRTDPNAYVCAVHWQVAQGTSLENMIFYMMEDGTTTQQVRRRNPECSRWNTPKNLRASIWKTEAVASLPISLLLAAILGMSIGLLLYLNTILLNSVY